MFSAGTEDHYGYSQGGNTLILENYIYRQLSLPGAPLPSITLFM